jgi:molybdopterin-guanine dinucleotide biosynthesis protein A
MESLGDTGEHTELRGPAPALAGVVLCGGRSVRMGVDKAAIDIGGMTLLERAVTRLRAVCDPVLIAPGDLDHRAGADLSVVDAMPDAGPLAGLVAALRLSPHHLLAVVAVDLPWLDPALLRLLAGRIGAHDAAVCETDRGVEPLHAVYARTALAAAEAALRGPDRSLGGLIDHIRALRVAEPEWRAAGISQRFTRNVNTPADLAELSLELGRQAS